jgi:hypothetical protein
VLYRGDYLQNRYHGKGTLNKPDGDRYTGSFVSGRYHGAGSYTSGKTGATYTGDFVAGRFHGVYVCVDALIYSTLSHPLLALCAGKGSYTYPSGDVFVGTFRHGTRIDGRMTYAPKDTAGAAARAVSAPLPVPSAPPAPGSLAPPPPHAEEVCGVCVDMLRLTSNTGRGRG